jgi:hypothetical protein
MRLGRVEAVRPTGDHDERFRHVGEVLAAREGDGVETPDGKCVVVATQGPGVTVEPSNGGERVTYYATPNGVTREFADPGVRFVRTGREQYNQAAERVEQELRSYGHGHADGPVTAVRIDGTRYEVVYRHQDKGIALASPQVETARRGYDARLERDPLGFRLVTGLYGSGGDREVTTDRVHVDELMLSRATEMEA